MTTKYDYKVYPEILTPTHKLSITKDPETENRIIVDEEQEFMIMGINVETSRYSDVPTEGLTRVLDVPKVSGGKYHLRYSANGSKIGNYVHPGVIVNKFYLVDCSNTNYTIPFNQVEEGLERFVDDILVARIENDFDGKISSIVSQSHESQVVFKKFYANVIDVEVLNVNLSGQKAFNIETNGNLIEVNTPSGQNAGYNFSSNKISQWELKKDGTNNFRITATSENENANADIILTPKNKVYVAKLLEVELKALFNQDIETKTNLIVRGTSNLNMLNVSGDSKVTQNSTVGGNLTVDGNIQSKKDLTVTGKVTGNSLEILTNSVVSGDLVVEGKLEVKGERTEIHTKDLIVEDNIITLNKNLTESTGLTAGIEIVRGSEAPANILYFELDKTFRIGVGDDYEVLQRIATRGETVTHKYIPVGDTNAGYTQHTSFQYDDVDKRLKVPNVTLANIDGAEKITFNTGQVIKPEGVNLQFISTDLVKGGIYFLNGAGSEAGRIFFNAESDQMGIRSGLNITLEPKSKITVTGEKDFEVTGNVKFEKDLTVSSNVVAGLDVKSSTVTVSGRGTFNDVVVAQKFSSNSVEVATQIKGDTALLTTSLEVPTITATADVNISGNLDVVTKLKTNRFEVVQDSTFSGGVRIQTAGLVVISTNNEVPKREAAAGVVYSDVLIAEQQIITNDKLVAKGEVTFQGKLTVPDVSVSTIAVTTKLTALDIESQKLNITGVSTFRGGVNILTPLSLTDLTVDTKFIGYNSVLKELTKTDSVEVQSGHKITTPNLETTELTSTNAQITEQLSVKDFGATGSTTLNSVVVNGTFLANLKSTFDQDVDFTSNATVKIKKSLSIENETNDAQLTVDRLVVNEFVDFNTTIEADKVQTPHVAAGKIDISAGLNLGGDITVQDVGSHIAVNGITINPTGGDIEFNSGRLFVDENMTIDLARGSSTEGTLILNRDNGDSTQTAFFTVSSTGALSLKNAGAAVDQRDIFSVDNTGVITTKKYSDLESYFLTYTTKAELDGRLDGHDTDISGINTDIVNINGRINTINSKINLDITDKLNELKGMADEIRSKVSQLHSGTPITWSQWIRFANTQAPVEEVSSTKLVDFNLDTGSAAFTLNYLAKSGNYTLSDGKWGMFVISVEKPSNLIPQSYINGTYEGGGGDSTARMIMLWTETTNAPIALDFGYVTTNSANYYAGNRVDANGNEIQVSISKKALEVNYNSSTDYNVWFTEYTEGTKNQAIPDTDWVECGTYTMSRGTGNDYSFEQKPEITG